jgi:hypothetical protein
VSHQCKSINSSYYSWLSSSLAAKLLRGVTRPSADVYSWLAACTAQLAVAMEGRVPSSRVAEWRQRKATNAPDPLLVRLAAQKSPQQPLLPAPQHDVSADTCSSSYTARLGGKVVARSSRVQHANRRVYFPIEDVVEGVLLPSPKRWR